MTIKPKYHEKQKKALRILLNFFNGVSELLYGGAAGGGKSWLGCSWILIMCLTYPGTRYLIGRSKLLALKQTTLKTFWAVCKDFGLKEGKDYKFNGQTNEIRFKNGSEIILKDLFQYPSDPEFDSLGSLEITGAFIDEVNQVTEKAKNVVMSRIRYKLDENGITPKIFMSCNPAKNWVYNTFYKLSLTGKLESYKRFIQALPEDNNYISKHYLTNLDKLDKVSRNRLKLGLWEYSDDLSLFDFVKIQETLARKRKPLKGSRYFIAADIARLGKDKTVIMVCSNTLEVVKIVTLSKSKTNKTAKVIKKLADFYGVDEYDIAIDSDGVGGGVIDGLEELGIENAVSIVNNSKALHGKNYENLKTQLYFKLQEIVENDRLAFNTITDEEADKLTEELQILRREKVEKDARVSMTTKAQVKQLIGRSPDFSDCLAYLMYFFLEEADDSYLAM
jgi:phage terminase large subunit